MEQIRKPKGTLDILPEESGIWQYIEGKIKAEAAKFGFSEIRVPTFEYTDLFCRGVGDTTDVVNKEMYSFIDKDGSNLSLRPEGTAGVARAVIENGLYAGALPLKLFYLANFFRREKPQAGRTREFWQFGAELYGSDSPMADAEVIILADRIFKSFGLKNVVLRVNSIGDKNCRPAFREALTAYFEKQKDKLCPTCAERLYKNPLRILDCKNPECKELAAGAPRTLDHLCGSCRDGFSAVCARLDACGVKYEIDPMIVRGLDYYNGTVFEFTVDSIGAQSTVCGGGRYDTLLGSIGGPELPAVGFGMGVTRLIQALKDEDLLPKPDTGARIYVASMGDPARECAFTLAQELRDRGVSADCDVCGRSLKAQMKYADKTGAKTVLVIGDNELASGEAELKDMRGGENKRVSISAEEIAKALK
ncbi:MAG: histidine--tRNA ligase [Clostridia bacterium]|nr:histidine--tRNA ligase [Clostridia bacterium]